MPQDFYTSQLFRQLLVKPTAVETEDAEKGVISLFIQSYQLSTKNCIALAQKVYDAAYAAAHRQYMIDTNDAYTELLACVKNSLPQYFEPDLYIKQTKPPGSCENGSIIDGICYEPDNLYFGCVSCRTTCIRAFATACNAAAVKRDAAIAVAEYNRSLAVADCIKDFEPVSPPRTRGLGTGRSTRTTT